MSLRTSHVCKGRISIWNPQQAENWCSYINSVTRKLQVTCLGGIYDMLCHGHKLSNLIVDRFNEPNALCDV